MYGTLFGAEVRPVSILARTADFGSSNSLAELDVRDGVTDSDSHCRRAKGRTQGSVLAALHFASVEKLDFSRRTFLQMGLKSSAVRGCREGQRMQSRRVGEGPPDTFSRACAGNRAGNCEAGRQLSRLTSYLRTRRGGKRTESRTTASEVGTA